MTASREWLSAQDLAAWLGVPVKTVYRWNTDGTGLRRYRFGRSVRYRMRDVEAWVGSRAVEEPARSVARAKVASVTTQRGWKP